jgi:hypothetical protein
MSRSSLVRGHSTDVVDYSAVAPNPALPAGVDLLAGLLSFQVSGFEPGLGERDVVSMTSAATGSVNGFDIVDPSIAGWTAFALDSDGIGADTTSGTGQSVTLNLKDGARGDYDRTIDGTITFVGGPVDATGTPFAPNIHFPVAHNTKGTITIPTNANQLNGASVQLVLLLGSGGGGSDAGYGIVSIDEATGSFIYTSDFTPKTFGGGPDTRFI